MSILDLPKVDAIKASNNEFTDSTGSLDRVYMAYLFKLRFYYPLQVSLWLISLPFDFNYIDVAVALPAYQSLVIQHA
jgi:hypothetical protein